MRNMKIEINEQQPLDEVIDELERLGFECGLKSENPKSIETYSDGEFDEYCFKQEPNTTLAELKEMNIETLEECLSWAACASSESWSDEQRDEIDKHYKVIEKAMIGEVK